jgi:hypothetical protein
MTEKQKTVLLAKLDALREQIKAEDAAAISMARVHREDDMGMDRFCLNVNIEITETAEQKARKVA